MGGVLYPLPCFFRCDSQTALTQRPFPLYYCESVSLFMKNNQNHYIHVSLCLFS